MGERGCMCELGRWMVGAVRAGRLACEAGGGLGGEEGEELGTCGQRRCRCAVQWRRRPVCCTAGCVAKAVATCISMGGRVITDQGRGAAKERFCVHVLAGVGILLAAWSARRTG